MAGYTISSNNYGVAYQGVDLVIKNGTFVAVEGGSYAIVVGWDPDSVTTATLESLQCTGGINTHNAVVTINEIETAGTKFYAIWCDENAHVTVNGGTFTSESTYNHILLNSDPTGSMKIMGGTYIAPSTIAPSTGKLYPDDSEGRIVIYGGKFNKDPSSNVAVGARVTEDVDEDGKWWIVTSAKGESIVTYSGELLYTIIIPTTFDFGNNLALKSEVAVNFLVADSSKQVNMTVYSQNGQKLYLNRAHSDNDVDYKMGKTTGADDAYPNVFVAYSSVAAKKTQDLFFTLANRPTVAGTYTDTLTFTTVVEDYEASTP